MIAAVLLSTAVIMAVVFIPLEMRLTAPDNGRATLTCRVGGIRVLRRDVKRGEARADTRSAAQRFSSARRAFSVGRRFFPLAGPMFGPPGRRWMMRSVKSVDVSAHGATVEVGLADPAQTGRLYGVLAGVIPLLRHPIAVVPCFDGPRLRAHGDLRLRSTLARLCGPSMRFAFEPAVLVALWRVLTRRDARPAAAT